MTVQEERPGYAVSENSCTPSDNDSDHGLGRLERDMRVQQYGGLGINDTNQIKWVPAHTVLKVKTYCYKFLLLSFKRENVKMGQKTSWTETKDICREWCDTSSTQHPHTRDDILDLNHISVGVRFKKYMLDV